MVALRSSSSSTMCCVESWSSAIWTMLTAPSTMRVRASMTAPACWRRSIALGDLGRVGEVADAGVHDLDAGLLQAALDLRLELLADLVRIAAQRQLVVRVRVVGVGGGERPDRRLRLDLQELLVVVDLEERLRGVVHAPDDDRRDLDRDCRRGR